VKRPSAIEVAQQLLAKAEDAEDPWLISYADLVTNLLAFMVLLVSMAGISFDSVERLPRVFSADARRPPLEALEADIAALASEEGLGGRVAAEVDTQGLAIRLEDRILFPSGVAGLTPAGGGLVERVAGLLGKLPERYRVVVEGHTDDVPIATARFASNWELSAARALAVRRALAAGGVDDGRLSIAAYADTRPPERGAAPLEARRQAMRRVVIRVGY
jgi:chemotaxis protein MotB